MGRRVFTIVFGFFGLGIGLVLIFVGGCVFERNLRLFEIYFGFLFLLYFVFGKRVFSLFFRILIRIFFSGEFRGWERIWMMRFWKIVVLVVGVGGLEGVRFDTFFFGFLLSLGVFLWRNFRVFCWGLGGFLGGKRLCW